MCVNSKGLPPNHKNERLHATQKSVQSAIHDSSTYPRQRDPRRISRERRRAGESFAVAPAWTEGRDRRRTRRRRTRRRRTRRTRADLTVKKIHASNPRVSNPPSRTKTPVHAVKDRGASIDAILIPRVWMTRRSRRTDAAETVDGNLNLGFGDNVNVGL
jgi:hypothetical protein